MFHAVSLVNCLIGGLEISLYWRSHFLLSDAGNDAQYWFLVTWKLLRSY